MQELNTELDSLRWFSQRRSPTPHFEGCATRSYDVQIRTRPRFLYKHRPNVAFGYTPLGKSAQAV